MSVQSPLDHVADLISSGKASRIVVLTGAGISTSAGIPDFRSPETGLYHNLQSLNLPFPEAVFELGYFKRNPKPFWTLAKELYPGKHYPTPTHHFLSLLHAHSALHLLFTQNIDTLETLAGLPPQKIVEAHGSFRTAHCLGCGREVSREYVLKSGVRKGEIVRCEGEGAGGGAGGTNRAKGCGGLVKPDIVFFGEGLPERFFKLIPELRRCDLLIVIGTSLQVHPFASLVEHVPKSTPRLLINREPVGPFSHLSKKRDGRGKRDMYWEGDADEGVRLLCERMGWAAELDRAVREGKERLDSEWEGLVGGKEEEDDEGSAAAEEGVSSDEGSGEAKAKAKAEKVGEEVRDEVGLGKVERGEGAKVEGKLGHTDPHDGAREADEASDSEEDEVEDLQRAIAKDLRL